MLQNEDDVLLDVIKPGALCGSLVYIYTCVCVCAHAPEAINN